MTETLIPVATVIFLYAIVFFVWAYKVRSTKGDWGYRFHRVPAIALFPWDRETESGRAVFLFFELWFVRGPR
jgi:hypothetical protein